MTKQIEELDLEKANVQNVTYDNNYAYLRGYANIKLHYSQGSHPAFGYKADINPYIIENDGKVEVVESNDTWSKIYISGWIPNWYLIYDKLANDEIKPLNTSERRTVIEDCNLYLTPDENSKINVDSSATKLSSGQVVEILYEYDDWYYVKRYILWDSNNFPEGWVKKSQVATFDEIKPSEVMIRKGTIIYESGKQIELDRNRFGRIESENDGWVNITLPGASFLKVKKDDVIYE